MLQTFMNQAKKDQMLQIMEDGVRAFHHLDNMKKSFFSTEDINCSQGDQLRFSIFLMTLGLMNFLF
ncbi:MAG: hypothetical protein CM15mP29_3640 [Alphaproteobacteria bacterium]|nr:MAG: hypothetical protein CM15mP29_3640 [Alphaproteobacteria bacterium]